MVKAAHCAPGVAKAPSYLWMFHELLQNNKISSNLREYSVLTQLFYPYPFLHSHAKFLTHSVITSEFLTASRSANTSSPASYSELPGLSMASTTPFSGLSLPHSVPICCNRNDARFAQPQLSLSFPKKPTSLKTLKSLPLRRRDAFTNGFYRIRRNSKQFSVRCDASSGRVT